MNASVQILAAVLSVVLPLAGCTTSASQSLALHRVGSAPDHLPTAPGEGLLLVTPDWLPLTSLDDPDMSVRASYKILSDDGALYRNVRLWGSEHHPEPLILRLPAGDYTLEGRASGYGRVGIPVSIENNRTTIVRLGGELDPNYGEAPPSERVSLPNGSMMGWRGDLPRAVGSK